MQKDLGDDAAVCLKVVATLPKRARHRCALSLLVQPNRQPGRTRLGSHDQSQPESCAGVLETLPGPLGVRHRGGFRAAARIQAYRLNCGKLSTVAGHGRLRFAMELPVPKVTSTARAKFGWELETGYGPAYVPIVTVQP